MDHLIHLLRGGWENSTTVSMHPLTRILISSEHLRLLHAGPTLLRSSLCCQFYIVGCRKIVCSIIHSCVTCPIRISRPQPQMMGQLPMENVTPDAVFDGVGMDNAGPVCQTRISTQANDCKRLQ